MPATTTKSKKDTKIKVKYIIPNEMKDCYVNGIYGGVSPNGTINAHFFSERPPIPKESVVTFKEDGIIDDVPEFGGEAVRLIQASIVMDFATAKALQVWLNEKIDILQERLDAAKKHFEKEIRDSK